MHTLDIDSLLPSQSDSSDISPKLIDLVLDIGEYMSRLQGGKDLIDEFTGNREAFVVRDNM